RTEETSGTPNAGRSLPMAASALTWTKNGVFCGFLGISKAKKGETAPALARAENVAKPAKSQNDEIAELLLENAQLRPLVTDLLLQKMDLEDTLRGNRSAPKGASR